MQVSFPRHLISDGGGDENSNVMRNQFFREYEITYLTDDSHLSNIAWFVPDINVAYQQDRLLYSRHLKKFLKHFVIDKLFLTRFSHSNELKFLPIEAEMWNIRLRPRINFIT